MNLTDTEILLIDDDPSHNLLVQKILEGAGAHVHIATSIEAGIKKMEEVVPHLLLLDVHLEGEDIFDLFEERRDWIEKLGAKIIIFSAAHAKEITAKAIAYGVHDYIFKPLNSALLLQKIYKNLAKKSAPRYLFSDRPSIKASLAGDLTQFNEFELILHAPIKIQKGYPLKITSEFLDKLNCPSLKFVSGGKASYLDQGLFKNHLYLTGADDRFRRTIQRYKNK